MNEFTCIAVTLYSHNLKELDKSFSKSFKIHDFKNDLYWLIKNAHRVTYVNPLGNRIILKDKKKNAKRLREEET